jgi:hypothetical protein
VWGLDHLQIERQKRHGAEHRHAHDKADQTAQQKRALPEKFEWHDRFSRAAFFVDEPPDRDEPHAERDPQLRRRPRQDRAALAREQNDAGECACKKRSAHLVDVVLDVMQTRLEDRADHSQRDDAGRQVDIENPAPYATFSRASNECNAKNSIS